jgi:serine/threonine protein kinase/tetratricopeptide (TPR) repeat protein
MPLELGSHLGPYTIKSVLGTGGMGEVYRARDARLERDVAIKVLPAEVSDDPLLRARFEREARAVAALSHPNIVTVHDFSESTGRLYIAFELIEGQTLEQRLDSGQLSVAHALDVARQIAEGLAHAHDAGVIHRDLKPRNIMVTASGLIKILDFGLGKFVRRPVTSLESTTTSGLSAAGFLLGTIGYMSPEQVRGAELDARSDQFVFGALLYEMLSGRRAFHRDSPVQTMSAILEDDPDSLAAVAPRTPFALLKVVSRCLAKRAEDRYASTRELLHEIRTIAADTAQPRVRARRTAARVALAVTAGGAAVALLFTLTERGVMPLTPASQGLSSEQISTLSLLPIETKSSDPAERAFWAGLTRALTTRLAALPAGRSVHVTPAADVVARGVRTPVEARMELGATHVLRGFSTRDGVETRTRLELVDISSNTTIREGEVSVGNHERETLQNRLLDTILSMVDVTLTAGERTKVAGPAAAAAGTHDFYLQGLGYLHDDSKAENVDSAVSVFQHALQLDPKHAPAHAGLGEAYWRKYVATRDARWVDAARQSCERALGLNEQEASPHRCLGTITSGMGEYEKSVEEFQHALAREPDDEVGHIGLAMAYDRLGLKKRAEETHLKAISIRPRYWGGYSRLGAFYYAERRYAEAERMFREVIALNPDSWRGYSNLGALYYIEGRTQEAIGAYEKSLALRPNHMAASNLGTLYFFDLQDYPRAAQAFRQAVALNADEDVVWGNLASALLWAGKADESNTAFATAAGLAEKRLAVNPRDANVTMRLAEYEAALNRESRARGLMDKALELAPGDARLMFQAGVLCEMWFKDRECAFEWLGRSLGAGYQWKEVERSPALTALRKDSRLEQLRQRAQVSAGARKKGA